MRPAVKTHRVGTYIVSWLEAASSGRGEGIRDHGGSTIGGGSRERPSRDFPSIIIVVWDMTTI